MKVASLTMSDRHTFLPDLASFVSDSDENGNRFESGSIREIIYQMIQSLPIAGQSKRSEGSLADSTKSRLIRHISASLDAKSIQPIQPTHQTHPNAHRIDIIGVNSISFRGCGGGDGISPARDAFTSMPQRQLTNNLDRLACNK